jgi:photosystem II stability/assembly factor-like uncharacterized protein
MKAWLLAAVPTVAIIVVGVAQTEHEHERAHADSRPKSPGTHRAKPSELAVRDRVGREESLKITRRPQIAAAMQSVPSTTWVNVGPTDAPQEVNFFKIGSVDSGRPSAILVDPRDPNVVYVAVSGGGLWKSFDFLSATGPSWSPTMDTQPNLAVGALALDPDAPDTLYVGNGDFVDASGDTVLKSTDGGGTWATPVALEGTNSAGFLAHPQSIRQLGVKGSLVLAATDVGLFASTDAGATFSLVDLPNAGGRTLAESVWSVASTGGTSWVAAGVTACDTGLPPPSVYSGLDPDVTKCPAGNNTALWRSDDGMTWTLVTTIPAATGTGRTTLAVGPTADPAHTRVYAYVGAVGGDKTLAFWRSDDAGATYVDATGALANPTINVDSSCTDIDIGHDQTWYNEAIVVDPTNPDHVLVGGNLCGMRTLNGTSASPTWELISHWLPGPGFGETKNGRLAYVHADWHTATSVMMNGSLRTFAGTDGGVFSSLNVFDAPAEQVTWIHHNKGLVTHLLYSIASGDPAAGHGFIAFAGLQDNGTRFRADPHDPSAFNQPIGGDGIGVAVHESTAGTTYWASVEFGRSFCKPAEVDCSTEVPALDGTSTVNTHWHDAASPLGNSERPGEPDEEGDEEEEQTSARMRVRAQRSNEDAEPFFIHYADVETDTTGESVLTHTDDRVFVAAPSGAGFTFNALSQDLSNDPRGAGFGNVTASRTIPGLYGAAGVVSIAPFYVTTHGNAATTWTEALPVHPDGTAKRLTGPASIDFPPVTPAGKQPGQVFIGSFTGTMNDMAKTPPPDDKGRLWRTTDGGQTWTSIVGSDPAHRLPNVAIYVVKYDPVTPTTIYAGTEIGVYLSTDDGATWNRMGDNLPMISVRDLYVAKNQEFIRAATYGRGVWEIYPSSGVSSGAPGNGDYDRNLRIDWVDLGAMAARLGETPATTTAPLYSWILDMTGADSDPPVQAITDADLAALLSHFGGHP